MARRLQGPEASASARRFDSASYPYVEEARNEALRDLLADASEVGSSPGDRVSVHVGPGRPGGWRSVSAQPAWSCSRRIERIAREQAGAAPAAGQVAFSSFEHADPAPQPPVCNLDAPRRSAPLLKRDSRRRRRSKSLHPVRLVRFPGPRTFTTGVGDARTGSGRPSVPATNVAPNGDREGHRGAVSWPGAAEPRKRVAVVAVRLGAQRDRVIGAGGSDCSCRRIPWRRL
jgi:hypothetical protein